MVNVFIALSQHHLDIFESKFLNDVTIRDNENILLTSDKFIINRSCWAQVHSTSFSLRNQEKTKLARIKNIVKKIKAYSKIIRKIDNHRNVEAITLYYSSLEDVLSNYMFFSFNKNLNGIVIEDGVLNYYTHTLDNVSKMNTFLKRMLVIPFNLKYKKYRGHTSGIDYNKCIRQYVRLPEYSVRPDKSEELVFNKRVIEEVVNDILIIGQEPYANLIGGNKFEEQLNKLFHDAKISSGYALAKTIYYKPHRNGPRIDYVKLKDFFEDKEVVVVETSDTIENIYFNQLRCRYIYTFDSSSVINIYTEASENLQESLKIVVMPLVYKELTSLFLKMNFKIINNDI